MKYLLLHGQQTAALAADPGEPPMEWIAVTADRDVRRGGNRLRPADAQTAATVRRRDGETLVTRGPYAELAEEIAGYDLIETADLDEAIEIASSHPTLWRGAIEIRPLAG